jgi:hypothetical protein
MLAKELGRRIIASGRRLVSGFGLGIGGAVLLGAWDEIYRSDDAALDGRLLLRPFPQGIPDSDERKRQWTAYREALLKNAGAVIFITGNKLDETGHVVDADGVREEFEIAVARGAYPIPIGATGYVARAIWAEVQADPERYLPGLDVSAELARLGDGASTNDELLGAVMQILERVRERSLTL